MEHPPFMFLLMLLQWIYKKHKMGEHGETPQIWETPQTAAWGGVPLFFTPNHLFLTQVDVPILNI